MDQKIKVLIAEESEKFRKDTKEYLARHGVDIVCEVSDGTDIFSKIKQISFFVLFCYIQMQQYHFPKQWYYFLKLQPLLPQG
jgi:DNA-binding NarL/FixJ family response regulator